MTDMNGNLFWKLLEIEHPGAERFCRRIGGGSFDGDDLYHDALLAAWRKFETLRNTESFRPWLYRIIVNEFKSRFRRTQRRLNRDFAATDPDVENVHDPEATMTARRWLQRAFAILSSQDKALVTLFELEGWSIAELAEMMGRPEGTVKSRLSRSRRRMRKEILKYLGKEDDKKIRVEGDYALRGSETTSE